jgi:hypothetical protein
VKIYTVSVYDGGMADDNPKRPCDRGDEIKLGPHLGGGFRPAIRHMADHEQTIGIVRPVREGEALTGNEFRIEPKDPANGVFHVRPPHVEGAGGRPAKVTSDEYRKGWDSIFGKQEIAEV